MKIGYDVDTGVLRIHFRDALVEESDEDKPTTTLDYDADGNIVGIEILDASKRMSDPMSVEDAVTRARTG